MAETGYLAAIRESYDTVAADYARLVAAPDAMDPVSRSMLAAFAELAGAAGLGPVADLGCGPGRVTAHLAGLGLPAFGLDLSPKMIYRSYLVPPARLSALLTGAGFSVTAQLESPPPAAGRARRPHACLLARKPAR